MIAAIRNYVQPIWRPNTSYYIHFKLKDEVTYNGSRNEGIYNYYYGFKTVGPIGHFEKKNPKYIKEYDENIALELQQETFLNVKENYPILNLGSYIDYKKSYPNADGNLLFAKPLFYGNEQCTINVYFSKPYMYHMFQDWKKYDTSGTIEYKSALNIIIKDAVSEDIIKYPLEKSIIVDADTVPTPNNENNDTSWTSDADPRIPENIRIIKSYIDNINAENSNIKCQFGIGEMIAPEKPKAFNYTVKVQNLKPSKLYTAMFFNAFDDNKDGEFEPQKNAEGNIIYDENQKIHEYVFVTSRYQNFREQILSYNLKIQDEESNVVETKQAVFDNKIDVVQKQIDNAYAVISGNNNAEIEALSTKFIHDFDKVIEGIFNMKPMHPSTSTDFIKVINQTTNDIVALLIRNPEPFNDPKIPIEDILDTLAVIDANGNVDTTYSVLHSKDYSQMLLMNSNKKIDAAKLMFKFKYKIWDNTQRKYISVESPNNIVITEPIIIK